MIFDSDPMASIRQKYATQPDFRCPRIAILDREPHFEGERDYIERTISEVVPVVRDRWIREILSENRATHIGAWFEVMLCGWLQERGAAVPAAEGNRPDFSFVHGNGRPVAIEARVLQEEKEERDRENAYDELKWLLKDIRQPFNVRIKYCLLKSQSVPKALLHQVELWLREGSDKPFRYNDRRGTQIMLTATRRPRYKKIAITVAEAGWVDPDSIRQRLKKKALKYRNVRRDGPYVIAILLESSLLNADTVIEAWFGQRRFVVDRESDKVIGESLDGGGLHYHRGKIQHTSVSGTLVFQVLRSVDKKARQICARYIENPFARIPCSPGVFEPLAGRFLKMAPGVMAWKRGQSEDS